MLSAGNHVTCRNCKADFLIDSEDIAFYDRMQVPPPTRCPDCRAQRRMAWWNEHNLYRKEDALTGKEVFSTYPEHAPIKVYDHDYWWSDAWDPEQYARDYDFSKPFFEQFNELMNVVPKPSREIKSLLNSDYSDNSSHLKNCYLCFDADFNENCMYSTYFRNSKDTLDVTNGIHDELCYELLSADRCYLCAFSTELNNCRNVWFSRDCEDCDHCFGCANLRHKKYCFFNEQLTKEEYERRVNELNLGSYTALRQIQTKARAFWQQHPYRFMRGKHNTNVTGDYIDHCKDVIRCFETYDSQRIRYSQRVVNGTSDSYDCTSWGDNSELIYESVMCGENNRNLKFCMGCWPGNQNLEYCIGCHSCQNCFGCTGLRKKEFCIFNRQYSKEDYEKLKEKIIANMKRDDEYGEFFPASMSPLAYNETVAIDYFPLTKEEAIKKGFAWRDQETREYKITIFNHQIPDNIKEVDSQITKEILECGNCKHAYRILDRELEFYQRFGLPLPRLCHNCRYTERLKLRNPLKWWKRQCAKCGREFETSYSPDRPEIVYCETCYQQEVM